MIRSRLLPVEVKWFALLIAVVAIVSAAVQGVEYYRMTTTGEAVIRSGPKGIVRHHITRTEDPGAFADALRRGAYTIGLCVTLALVSGYFFRKLNDSI